MLADDDFMDVVSEVSSLHLTISTSDEEEEERDIWPQTEDGQEKQQAQDLEQQIQETSRTVRKRRSYRPLVNGEKRHKCQLCQYATNNSSHLTAHMRVHTGERPFKCKFCPYAATQSSSLNTHTRNHTKRGPMKSGERERQSGGRGVRSLNAFQQMEPNLQTGHPLGPLPSFDSVQHGPFFDYVGFMEEQQHRPRYLEKIYGVNSNEYKTFLQNQQEDVGTLSITENLAYQQEYPSLDVSILSKKKKEKITQSSHEQIKVNKLQKTLPSASTSAQNFGSSDSKIRRFSKPLPHPQRFAMGSQPINFGYSNPCNSQYGMMMQASSSFHASFPIHSPQPVLFPYGHPNPTMPAMNSKSELILRRIEWYLSPQNLKNNSYLSGSMDSDGFFSLTTIFSLPKVQALSSDLTFIRQALQYSTKFELSADCLKVRPQRDWIPSQEHPRNSIDQYKRLGREINFVIASEDSDTESDGADSKVNSKEEKRQSVGGLVQITCSSSCDGDSKKHRNIELEVNSSPQLNQDSLNLGALNRNAEERQ
ncbi:zinc-finger double domain-containing protein [Ditylenchus destructor]|nr:zinc-finger double domain-containing protein [Ditylenchus destructor]